VSYTNHTAIHSPNDEKATMHLQSLYSLFSQNTLVTDCFICRPYLSPLHASLYLYPTQWKSLFPYLSLTNSLHSKSFL